MEPQPVPFFRMRVLGGLEVRTADGRYVTPPGRKLRALLACLALPPSSPWSREQLVALLWGDREEEQARGSLREALVKLRRCMGDPNPLQTTRDTVALDPAVISIDAMEFVRLAKAGELEQAAELYRGELLEGLTLPDGGFEDWCLVERTRLHDLAVDVLSRLLASQGGRLAVQTGQRLLELEPTREETHRTLMRLYAATGDRSQALHQYQMCRDHLKGELGVAPSPETDALYRQIGADPGTATPCRDDPPRSLPVTLRRVGVRNVAAPEIALRVGQSPMRRRAVSIIAAMAIVLALIAISGLRWYWTDGKTRTAAKPAIAVLPFDNLSEDPANGRLAGGITADIITDLSRYSDFAVIARESSEVYKGKPVDVRQIGKDLNVSHILEGSFQREGDQVRINVQLVDAATGISVWSDRYDRPAGEVFAIQSDVADRIANSLGGHEGPVASSLLTATKRKQPADLGAYELYLLAKETMRTGLTDESQLEAERLLQQAIVIDPSFARARVQLAWSYSWRATYEADTATLNKEMLTEARRAVELDPMDANAHEALGYALGLTGDLKQAEIQFDEARRLNPNAFDILTVYACWAVDFGKAKAGAEAVDRAMQLNPNYPAWAIPCLREGLVMVGRYEDVVRVQLRQPEDKWNTDGFVIMAGSLAMLGRLDEAKALVARGVVKYPGLLSIEKFALNRDWAAPSSAVIVDLMRKAGFPTCAGDKDLQGIAKPKRLPECVKAQQ
jgi:TolB-like protein/DNA-binding SARP family transcriptional activator/tetratricopeptide (TPR) repeat protein